MQINTESSGGGFSVFVCVGPAMPLLAPAKIQKIRSKCLERFNPLSFLKAHGQVRCSILTGGYFAHFAAYGSSFLILILYLSKCNINLWVLQSGYSCHL